MMKFLMTNWLGIVLATVAAMAIGSLWYSNLLFGKEWRKLAKLSEKEFQAGVVKSMVFMLVLAFVSAFVLKRFIVIAGPVDVLAAIKIAIWIWFGFVMTYSVSNAMFGKRSLKLIAIDLSNQLITLIVMAAILFKVN